MPNVQSRLFSYRKLIPAKYMNRVTLELQRTFLVALSLLNTHRRKALLLSLEPATIFKFVTVILPIIKLLPPTIKAIKTLSYFTTSSGSNSRHRSNSSNGVNALANRDANAAAAAEGLGTSMDVLNEILWTPAEDSYWERVNAMVSCYGLCKTLGITLAGVQPGRVEVVMPFRAEVSGEGGAFHASLLPTLIAMTSQLTGTTLLPRHFTLKPIDFKCNILSDCDSSTYLLISRGAVVVRGDHSITVKVEIMKASGLVPGSTEVIASPSASNRPSMFSWKSWVGPSSAPASPSTHSPSVLVPGTGIERSKLIVCASGTQTSVVVRAGTDQNDEEENEIQRLKRERAERLRLSSSSSSTTSSVVDMADDSIVLGDSIHFATPFNLNPPRTSSPRPMSPTATTPKEQPPHNQCSQAQSMDSSTFEAISPSSSFVTELKTNYTSIPTTVTTIPMSYASVVRHGVEQDHDPQYEETSDTEAWQT
ncbi:hypothetical protein BGZ58_003138 [Dissophora ornata]|nr:hypothetical protein BGZ58_003138 [Dissophora ornata]